MWRGGWGALATRSNALPSKGELGGGGRPALGAIIYHLLSPVATTKSAAVVSEASDLLPSSFLALLVVFLPSSSPPQKGNCFLDSTARNVGFPAGVPVPETGLHLKNKKAIIEDDNGRSDRPPATRADARRLSHASGLALFPEFLRVRKKIQFCLVSLKRGNSITRCEKRWLFSFNDVIFSAYIPDKRL
jgi:hypothetical protein